MVRDLIEHHKLKEGAIRTWKSVDHWVAATISHGKLFYAGGETEEAAIERLKNMIRK